MSYAKLIVNPAAGAGKTAKIWPQIRDRLNNLGLRFEHELTEAPGHAMELAGAAAKKGWEMVVSVGGDGTIHEVVNGLNEAGHVKDVMLGIINTGTGADYIRTIGIPFNYKEACQRLTDPKKLVVDLGLVEYQSNGSTVKRLFVNFAGLGFDAEVVRTTTHRFKALGSTASYLMALLTTLLSYHNRQVSLKIDGETEQRRVCTVIMSNGKYGGGNMLVSPHADPGDGFLDVLIIGDLSKPDLIRSLPRVYKGTHLTHPKVTAKRVKEIEIQPTQPIAVQADGELLGETPARFKVLPATLNLAI